MNVRRKTLATLVAAAALTVWGGSAQAGVIAQSVLELSDFTFLNPDGSTIDLSQFDTISFSDSSDITATLNGTTADTSVGPVTTFGGIDPLQQCVGDCIFAENDYTHHSVPTLDVARGDTLLTGSPITGTGFAVGADAHTLAEAQLTNTGIGSAEDNLGLLATISFVLGDDQIVGLSFNQDIWLKAFVELGSDGTAQARSFWSISLSDSAGNVLFDWTPDGVLNTAITGGVENSDACDLTRTVGAALPGQDSQYACTGFSEAFTNFVLLAGETYTLTIAHESTADAALQAVPEPSVLALLGIGLLGMGLGGRRSRKQAD